MKDHIESDTGIQQLEYHKLLSCSGDILEVELMKG